MKEAAKAEKKGWSLSKKGNKDDKKALADAGMTVGKVNAELKNILKKWALQCQKNGLIEQGLEDKLFLLLTNNKFNSKKKAV